MLRVAKLWSLGACCARNPVCSRPATFSWMVYASEKFPRCCSEPASHAGPSFGSQSQTRQGRLCGAQRSSYRQRDAWRQGLSVLWQRHQRCAPSKPAQLRDVGPQLINIMPFSLLPCSGQWQHQHRRQDQHSGWVRDPHGHLVPCWACGRHNHRPHGDGRPPGQLVWLHCGRSGAGWNEVHSAGGMHGGLLACRAMCRPGRPTFAPCRNSCSGL